MDHHLDIRLMEVPEFSAPILMNVLFSQLHRALVDASQGDIAVSFPAMLGQSLGNHLRIHGSVEALNRLEQLPWRKGLNEYMNVTAICPSPFSEQHCLVSRIQVKSNADRLRRRAMKRHGITYQQACQQIPDTVAKQLDLPFVQINSQSTQQTFRLFIKQSLCAPLQADLAFSKYGLSNTASVPWF
jgi:CRISPR-associated endonuclease Csy4